MRNALSSGSLIALCLALFAMPPLRAPAVTPAGVPPTSNPEAEDVVPEPAGYWTGAINGPTPATLAGGKVIRARELAALLKRGGAVTIDVSNEPQRPEGLAPDAVWMPLPQRIIPGSLWIPGAGVGEIDPAIDARFREELARATDNDPQRPVVVYCHERCWLSWNAAKRAISYGYRNVYWFPDGIEGWRAAGLPTTVVETAQYTSSC
jgi:PQQ-dependent catabolism-associated CXXCW motif protein